MKLKTCLSTLFLIWGFTFAPSALGEGKSKKEERNDALASRGVMFVTAGGIVYGTEKLTSNLFGATSRATIQLTSSLFASGLILDQPALMDAGLRVPFIAGSIKLVNQKDVQNIAQEIPIIGKTLKEMSKSEDGADKLFEAIAVYNLGLQQVYFFARDNTPIGDLMYYGR